MEFDHAELAYDDMSNQVHLEQETPFTADKLKQMIKMVNNKINDIAGMNHLIQNLIWNRERISSLDFTAAETWFKNIIGLYTNNEIDKVDQYCLWILLNKSRHGALFSELSEKKLPVIRRLHISFIDSSKYEDIRRFIKFNIPSALKELELVFTGDRILMTDWIDDITICLKSVTEIFEISNAEFSDESLNKFLSAGSHLQDLKIWDSLLNITSKFSIDDKYFYFIRKLRFFNKQTDWELECANSLEDIENIINAISKSRLARNLESVWFGNFMRFNKLGKTDYVDEQTVKEILSKFNLKSIKVQILDEKYY